MDYAQLSQTSKYIGNSPPCFSPQFIDEKRPEERNQVTGGKNKIQLPKSPNLNIKSIKAVQPFTEPIPPPMQENYVEYNNNQDHCPCKTKCNTSDTLLWCLGGSVIIGFLFICIIERSRSIKTRMVTGSVPHKTSRLTPFE